MVVLDKITELKKQGFPTSQIIQNLKEQGISPREINEALSQSDIKLEVEGEEQNENVFPEIPESIQQFQTPVPIQPIKQFPKQTQSFTGMQPSIGSRQYQQTQEVQEYQPETQIETEYRPKTQIEAEYQPQETQNQDFSYQQQYPDQYQYQEYQPQNAVDIETINDIASQILEEKTKNFKKELIFLTKFKKESEEKIKEIDARLAKIENTFEELQLAIIRKIGDYGEDIKNLSNEMRSTQESFSKILNPLTDQFRGIEESEETEMTKTQKIQTKSKPKPQTPSKNPENSFEDYLR